MRHHRCFQIETPSGLQAKVHGNPDMEPKTLRALGELIDAAMKIEPKSRDGGLEDEETQDGGRNL